MAANNAGLSCPTVSAGLSVGNALCGKFFLKESLAHENRRKIKRRRVNPPGGSIISKIAGAADAAF